MLKTAELQTQCLASKWIRRHFTSSDLAQSFDPHVSYKWRKRGESKGLIKPLAYYLTLALRVSDFLQKGPEFRKAQQTKIKGSRTMWLTSSTAADRGLP